MWKAVAAAALVVELCLAGNVFAQSATKDECVAKCKEAAQLVTDKGIDAAIAEINKKDGPFVWKDSYVFMMDLEGKMLAHPIRPDLIGKNLLETPDKGPDKKLFFKEFVGAGEVEGRGLGRLRVAQARRGSASKKLSYIYRVPGKDVFVGAGVYE